MIGDKLVIEDYHTDRAAEVCELLANRIQDGFADDGTREGFWLIVEFKTP